LTHVKLATSLDSYSFLLAHHWWIWYFEKITTKKNFLSYPTFGYPSIVYLQESISYIKEFDKIDREPISPFPSFNLMLVDYNLDLDTILNTNTKDTNLIERLVIPKSNLVVKQGIHNWVEILIWIQICLKIVPWEMQMW
jgi:hypothetical protein